MKLLWACLIGSTTAAMLLACGDGGETNDGGTGGAGAAGASGSTSSSTTGSATNGSTTSSTSSTSSATSSGGGGSGGGEPIDPQSTACTEFPETVALGATIDPSINGAVLCYSEVSESCRLTTNTYSDGTNPCPTTDSIVGFFGGASDNYVRLPSTWTIDTSTAGMIEPSFPYVLTLVPTGESVTMTITSPIDATYTVVFSFETGGMFTMTSFVAD